MAIYQNYQMTSIANLLIVYLYLFLRLERNISLLWLLENHLKGFEMKC